MPPLFYLFFCFWNIEFEILSVITNLKIKFSRFFINILPSVIYKLGTYLRKTFSFRILLKKYEIPSSYNFRLFQLLTLQNNTMYFIDGEKLPNRAFISLKISVDINPFYHKILITILCSIFFIFNSILKWFCLKIKNKKATNQSYTNTYGVSANFSFNPRIFSFFQTCITKGTNLKEPTLVRFYVIALVAYINPENLQNLQSYANKVIFFVPKYKPKLNNQAMYSPYKKWL